MAEIRDLPFELLEKVLSSLDGAGLFQCRIVCRTWKNFIDENEHLWRLMCEKEFKVQAKIAKTKCGDELTWYQIFRNLKKWPLYANCGRSLKKFYHFTTMDNQHALSVESGILPLREAKGVMLYDMKTLKYMPVAILNKNVLKLSNNHHTTVIQLKNCILVQRNVSDKIFTSEATYKADHFVLADYELYFSKDREIFKCNLNKPEMNPVLFHSCKYDIKEILFSYGMLYIFTQCGNILNINSQGNATVQRLKLPEEWIQRIRYMTAFDDNNYVCFSRNFFQIQAGDYYHLYVEFPCVTALFFYGDVLIIGTKAGEIILYWVKRQKPAQKPDFQIIGVIPEGKFPVTLDVYERKEGPVIVASTLFDVFLLEINLFPEEVPPEFQRKTDNNSKLTMYQRLLKIKNRINT